MTPDIAVTTDIALDSDDELVVTYRARNAFLAGDILEVVTAGGIVIAEHEFSEAFDGAVVAHTGHRSDLTVRLRRSSVT